MTPTLPGLYWARWLCADPGTEFDTEMLPEARWTVVDVYENVADPDHAEHLRVLVPGERRGQSLGNFEWQATPRRLAPPSPGWTQAFEAALRQTLDGAAAIAQQAAQTRALLEAAVDAAAAEWSGARADTGQPADPAYFRLRWPAMPGLRLMVETHLARLIFEATGTLPVREGLTR